MRYLVCFALFFILDAQAQILKEKTMVGRIEWVQLPDLKLRFRSRIDTGAKTTSLHAFDIKEEMRDGILWVRFKTRDEEGKEVELTRKVESVQKVANAGGASTKRYVIREKIKLGPQEKEIALNLNDREKMTYKFLVGRNLLLGLFTVDVARSHVLGD
ncbi:MAG: RimK/LysX family protein [Proteobacteria bacterium]|jgi:hypothetical protein|nr:RimK/LysX family protein [Pseudomonadota bacterium]